MASGWISTLGRATSPPEDLTSATDQGTVFTSPLFNSSIRRTISFPHSASASSSTGSSKLSSRRPASAARASGGRRRAFLRFFCDSDSSKEFYINPSGQDKFQVAWQIAELTVKSALPPIHYDPQFGEAGWLMTYGVDRRAAFYVDKILKGGKPADLPVEQPTKFELVINLETAKQIGLPIPPNVLARADRVIR